MSRSTYSLWLEPNGEIAYKLQERIKKLSKMHDTPVFAPHGTLLGGLQASETELVSLTNTLASSLHPFELTLTKAGYHDRFYQSLFVYIEKTDRLLEARNIACRLFDQPDTDGYLPHLSLLYGDLSRNEKERIINIMGREFYTSFSAKSIVLMQTEGQPEQWKKIHTSVFKL